MLPRNPITDTETAFGRIHNAATAEEEAAGDFNALIHLFYARVKWGQLRALGHLPAGVAA